MSAVRPVSIGCTVLFVYKSGFEVLKGLVIENVRRIFEP